MKKIVFSTIIYFLLVFSLFAQKSDNLTPFTLKGKINSKSTAKMVLRYRAGNKIVFDTTIVNNCDFVFMGNIGEPTHATLNEVGNRNSIEFFIEPTQMQIDVYKYNPGEFALTGSKTQDENEKLNGLKKEVNEQINANYNAKMKLRDSLNKIQDKEKIKLLEEIFDKKSAERKTLDKQKQKIELDFIQSHPKSYLSPYLLTFFDKNEEISLDSLKMIYDGFDPMIQKSLNGNEIHNDIQKKKNVEVGAFVPDFKAKGVKGEIVTYSQFKGKNVVLMDFWASWCGPCRAAFPHVKKLYQKYQPQGFEVITISSDWKKDAWINAIKQDSIENWHNIPVAERFADGPAFLTPEDVYSNYFVQAIPVQLLINKEGKVVGRWLGYSEENERDLDKKMAELFH